MLTIKVKETMRKYSLVNSGDRVVVAVSGGPDSVCLLSVLALLSDELGVTLHIAHLDHMFRGRESADEALFVAGIARKLGIPATVEKIDVPAYCRDRGLSAQAGARAVRYAFLSRVAKKFQASRIATGHTAGDQAETFLLRLLRGAGVRGLSAIPPRRENIIRPLIEVTREEILEHLHSNALDFVLDPSNQKPVYTRNRIRMDLLPVLSRFNPRIVQTLASEASLLRDEDEAAEFCLTRIATDVLEQEQDLVLIQKKGFHQLPKALRRRLLRRAVEISGVEPGLFSSVQIDEALGFMESTQTGRTMHLPCGLLLEREYEKIILRRTSTAQNFSHILAFPGITKITELGWDVEAVISESAGEAFDDGNYFWQALFDYDKIGPVLEVRSRLPGDWFCPAGMGGKRKKIQDFFVDVKVPRGKRDAVPLVVSGDDVIWVAGHRIDERFRLCAETKKVLVVRFRIAESGIKE